MVLDTSALFALLLNEPDAPGIGRTLARLAPAPLTAASYVVILRGRSPALARSEPLLYVGRDFALTDVLAA